MKSILASFFRQIFFWILFFDFTRLVFILYYSRQLVLEGISFSHLLGVFVYSFRLDLATTCYFMLFPFLLLVIQSLYSPRWLNWVNKTYAGIIILFYSFTESVELGIYDEWKTKVNFKVIRYLDHPSEIYNSAETSTFFLLILIFVFMAGTGLFAYSRWFYRDLVRIGRHWWFCPVFLLITPGLLFIALRGGIKPAPINQSQSMYSEHNILNVISVNNAFNLYISVYENLGNFDRNPYIFMEDRKAERIVNTIYSVKRDTTVRILSMDRPNIVMLILESWSADLIEDLGGKPGITPEFRELEKEGILFTRIYASGPRSEHGMSSIFAAFPSHPLSCITIQPDKFSKLPSLSRELEAAGYSTAFYFGGQLIYGNIRGFIYHNGFNKIMEEADFPATFPHGKLGIPDEFTLNYLADDIASLKPPFLAALFTLSTHSPWDQPYAKPLTWGDNEREYINAALYTDHCLGEFFRKVSKLPWYDSTLFVIVADHSHNSYYNYHPHSREYHKIPLLFYGTPIRKEFRGTSWDKLGNQHDLASTLLNQIGMPDTNFHWSKNLFNPFTRDFAYYTNYDGCGWLDLKGYFSFGLNAPEFYFLEYAPGYQDTLFMEGKAYLQMVFREYLAY